MRAILITKSSFHYLILFFLLFGSFIIRFDNIALPLLALIGIFIALLDKPNIDLSLIKLIFLPMLLIFIGLINSSQNSLIVVIKDLYQYLNPVLIMMYGFLISRYLNFYNFIKILVLAGLLSSIFFIFSVVFFEQNIETIRQLKKEIGVLPMIVPFSLGMLILMLSQKINIFSRKVNFVIFTVNIIAIYMSFSRTMWVVLLILLFGAYFRLSLAGIFKSIATMTAAAIILVTIFSNVGFLNNLTSPFISKVSSSMDEIAISEYSNRSEINSNWRGYESLMGLIAYQEGNASELILGHGLGKEADLGINMKLGNQYFSSIYQFHNGYINILLKTGVLGIFIYFLFFTRIIWKSVLLMDQISLKPTERFCNRALMLIAFIILANTITVSGWLNKNAMVSIILTLGWLNGFLSSSRKRLI